MQEDRRRPVIPLLTLYRLKDFVSSMIGLLLQVTLVLFE